MSKTYRKNLANNYDDTPKGPSRTFKEDLEITKAKLAQLKAARLEKAATTPLPRPSLFTGLGRSRRRRTRRVLTKKLRKGSK